MNPYRHIALLALAALLASTAAQAQDRADIDRTQIIGNRELPKVLYIVPWKKPLPGQLSGRPVQSVLDEALAPVDRDVFRRQASYDAQLRARSTAVAAAPAALLSTPLATSLAAPVLPSPITPTPPAGAPRRAPSTPSPRSSSIAAPSPTPAWG